MILAIYFLAAFGLAYVVGHSVISKPWREVIAIYAYGNDGGTSDKRLAWLLTLIECPMCFSWWVGLVCGLIGWRYEFVRFDLAPWALPIVLPWATTASSFIIAKITGLVE